ncbi:MAG: GINS complex subunit Sld5 [uncultured Acidilobus sp. MG]|nr:MAG: GINS complex subunit Sld5 [uncultured Acidilobus sp. MG]
MKLTERLRLIELDSLLRPVRVMILRDYVLTLPEGKLSVKKGDEVEVPRWMVQTLMSRGVAKPKDVVDVNYINSYHYKERRTSAITQLSQLPQDFYVAVGEYLRRLDEEIRAQPSHMLINDRDVSEKSLLELSQLRLNKIMRLAQTDTEEDVLGNMTPEEALVYSVIRETVNSWRKYIQSLIGGGAQ